MTPAWRRGRRARIVLWLALTLVASPDAGAGGVSNPAMARIERMVTAARTLNYDATFVYTHGGKMDEMRIIHRYGADGERERLITLSGAAREVLRDETQVTCIIPDSESVVVGKSRPQSLYGSPVLTAEGYAEHYDVLLGGVTRVAGRAAEEIRIRPRDEFRYGYRLWVDRKLGLLLRSELVDATDSVLESIVYTSIRIPEVIPDALLEPEISGNGFSWYTTSTSSASEPGTASRWQPRWLPSGFRIRDRESTPLPAGRMPLEHLVYGDGLASVSIYIEQLERSAAPMQGISTMGAMNAYGRIVDGLQVTVVGEVPSVTVRGIGDSVEKAR